MKEAHKDDQFDYVVLSAPTVDISNLDTSKVEASNNIDGLREAIQQSCKNIFSTAENVIKSYPDLKKVVILEHPPRYDMVNVDPLSLKPELAEYANTLYRQLWFESTLEGKIIVGKHNLKCQTAKIYRSRPYRVKGEV